VASALGLACQGSGDAELRDTGTAATIDAAAPPSPSDASADASLRDAAVPDAGDPEPDAGLVPSPGDSDYLVLASPVVPAHGVFELAFDVPGDALSFVLTVRSLDMPRTIELLSLQGSGEVLFDASAGTRTFAPGRERSLSPYHPYTVMLPSSPELPLRPGTHRALLRLRGLEPSQAQLGADVVFERGAVPAPDGRLSVALWFLSGAALDAETAQADGRLPGGIARMAEIFASIGLELESDYRDLTSASLSPVLTDDAAIAAVVAALEAEPQQAPALDLVFVDELAFGPEITLLARGTGIPGPPAHPVLGRRGAVVVSLATLPAAPEQIGELLAHEAAHYLGLRHTSEYDGLRHDPIADTPECPSELASAMTADGQPVLSVEDCLEHGADNLMFCAPAQGAFPQELLTDGQAFVLLRNPLVQ
jgi:hypothetical protein